MTVFIAAEPRECTEWTARWSDIRVPELGVHWARQGSWKGRPMLAIANGAGRARSSAAAHAAAALNPESIYSIGYCGALDDSLGIGDIFVATTVRSAGEQYPTLEPTTQQNAKAGILASVNRIIQTTAEKRELRKTGALAVEMEAAGVAAAANQSGMAFYCVRAVSDLAGEGFANDFNACLQPDGRLNVPRLVFHAMGSPKERFGELLRLSKRASLASRNLGAFLAECTY